MLWCCRNVRVVQPLCVEVPRSMVQVVTSWNVPMSQWLKTCRCPPWSSWLLQDLT